MASGAIVIPENLTGRTLKVVTNTFSDENSVPVIDYSKLSAKFDHTGKNCVNNGALSGSISQGVQSTTYGIPSIAYGISDIAYTDRSIATGDYTRAGTRSFRVVSGDLLEKSWTLKNTDGISPGMLYSVRLLNNYDMPGVILSVDAVQSKIYVDGMPWTSRKSENLSDEYLSGEPYWMPEGNGLRGHPSNVNSEYGLANLYPPNMCFSDAINQLTDFNTLWIVGHPELGDISSFSVACHTEGYGTIAQKQWSHAEGVKTIAAGKYSHTEGMYTYAGYSAHAEGMSSVAAVMGSHAEGSATSCFGYYGHVGGRRSLVPRDQQYVYAWNGANSIYKSHGTGTYNVNPVGGADGFYIGENTLISLISTQMHLIVQNIVDTAVENVLRTVMNPTDEECLDKIWKGAIFEMDDEGKKRVFYSDLSGLSQDGTWYAFPFWHLPPEVDNNPKAHLVGIRKLDPRISCIGNILAVDTPEGETIMQCGFNSCKKLEFANFENISRLYSWTFSTCVKLSSVNVPNLKQIDDHCFVSCRNLSSIALPSVTRINVNAFDDCYEGLKLDFSGKTDGIVPKIYEATLSAAPAGMQIIVPPEMLDEWKAAPYWSDYVSSIIAAE